MQGRSVIIPSIAEASTVLPPTTAVVSDGSCATVRRHPIAHRSSADSIAAPWDCQCAMMLRARTSYALATTTIMKPTYDLSFFGFEGGGHGPGPCEHIGKTRSSLLPRRVRPLLAP